MAFERIYDYDDVNENRSGYFDYYDPCDYEEWCGWDDPVDDGTCYDPYRSDVTGGGTVFSRAWLGIRSDDAITATKLTVTEITDRSPSITPDFGRKNRNALAGSGEPITRGYSVHGCPDAG